MENPPTTELPDIMAVSSPAIIQTPAPAHSKTNLLIPIISTVIVSAIVFGFGGYYLGKQSIPTSVMSDSQIPNIQSDEVIQVSPTMTPAVQSPLIDETTNWKTYSSTVLSFKYPQNFTLEERQKDFIVLLSDANNPQSVIVSVDARQTGNYADYEKAVLSTKAGLTSVQVAEIPNGTKISGKLGPGYGEGQQITIALFKAGSAAIEADTTTTDASQLQLFNHIISTFKFTY